MGSSSLGKPIVIADYDPAWVDRFEQERDLIYRTCGRDAFVRIEHVGSTSVPGLAAKPIIDLMPGVRSLGDAQPLIRLLKTIGYQYVPEFEQPSPERNDPGMPFRRYFRKDVDGVRAFHMHMVEAGSEFWTNHLRFRNYLRTEPVVAREYADLKRAIAAEFNASLTASSNTNHGYTDRKGAFVEDVLARARARVARGTPVVLATYDPAWPAVFERERERLAHALGGVALAIEHVGSTSVPGLAAKPTIDIAIGLRDTSEIMAKGEAMAALGYRSELNFEDWAYHERKDREAGIAYHVHGVPLGGERWTAYVAFRDALRSDASLRAEYEALKRANAAEFQNDRLGYVEAKTEFVRGVIRRALAGSRAPE